jgi:hypothetical protein
LPSAAPEAPASAPEVLWQAPEESQPSDQASPLQSPLQSPPESPPLADASAVSEDQMRDHAGRTTAALEQWLAAIHVTRPDRSA